jgi:hypothetical protein
MFPWDLYICRKTESEKETTRTVSLFRMIHVIDKYRIPKESPTRQN